MKNAAFFSTDQLTVGYHGKPLICDIEIHLMKGRILALIGPNGSGKSTILKTITKYLESLHGTVSIGGQTLTEMSAKELAQRLSVVLTHRMKTEHMSCEEVIESGRYPHTGMLGILSAEDHRQVEEAMDLVHASPLRDQDFMLVSDGERQRVLLARAICQKPEIIVLDEPTTFLDIHYKLELMEILRDLARKKHIAVILSLHELDMAQRVADDILCVKGETISHYGSTEEILQADLIRDLYDLDNGSFNPLFSSLEMSRTPGTPRLFVIAGGGSGIPVYRILQKQRIPFITGILHENDVDCQVARELAAKTITEKSFRPISEEIFARACMTMRKCSTVLNCLSEFGPINQKNADLAAFAESCGLSVVSQIGQLQNIPDFRSSF